MPVIYGTQCYLCGSSEELTEDHVPPESLAPNATRDAFYLVPCCSKCNNSYSHEESKFRDLLATVGAHSGIVAAEEAFQAARRNFQGRPERQNLYPSKDLLRIINNIERRPFIKSGIYLGDAHFLKVPKDLDLDRITIKIARGLHFAHARAMIPSHYHMEAQFFRPEERLPELENLVRAAPTRGYCGDFFSYAGGWAQEDPHSGFWVMVFYKRVILSAWFMESQNEGD